MFGHHDSAKREHPKDGGLFHNQQKYSFFGHVRYSPSHIPPENFLGKIENNTYLPVGVVWRSSKTVEWGSTHGEDYRGGLFWSPKLLEIPSFGKEFYPVSNDESSEIIWNASN
jgi:hypothetical protein